MRVTRLVERRSVSPAVSLAAQSPGGKKGKQDDKWLHIQFKYRINDQAEIELHQHRN